ncbi:MAG: winged helix-turn-helix domain-containing protein [Anaerolineales bacterium]
MTPDRIPYASLVQQVIEAVVRGDCVSIIGLSNTGKSTLMRGMAGAAAEEVYQKASKRPGSLIYVDCNRAVDLSAQAFYEVVLRSALERMGDDWSPELTEALRNHYQAITEADNAFAASLAFNLALTDLCEQLGEDVCLLIDEFDEIYNVLEERALLNLRALRDRFHDRLAYVTATVRTLPQTRESEVQDEFAELFSRAIVCMPLLDQEEAFELVRRQQLHKLGKDRLEACWHLAGGHPGLLLASAQTLAALPKQWQGDLEATLRAAPGPRSECMKIWNQLTKREQQGLITLVLEPQAGLNRTQIEELTKLGLVEDRTAFSPVFAEFVARRGRGPEVTTEGVALDADAGDVWVDGVRIPVLTDLEFRLLKLLFDRRDKLTNKYRIVMNVWGEEYLGDVDDARVEKLVSRLRSKIEPDPATPRYLITQRGRGYKLLSRPISHGS